MRETESEHINIMQYDKSFEKCVFSGGFEAQAKVLGESKKCLPRKSDKPRDIENRERASRQGSCDAKA